MGNHPDAVGHPEWYIWKVRAGKFQAVKEYLDKNVKEVTDVVCPMTVSEGKTKAGVKKTKTSPLYIGYVFLRYTHDAKNPTTWFKINQHPFINGYIGPCTASDIETIVK